MALPQTATSAVLPTYRIAVKNPNGVEKGVAGMTMDGEHINRNPIPLDASKKEVNVEVTMG